MKRLWCLVSLTFLLLLSAACGARDSTVSDRMEKIQGTWISVGQSGSVKWEIEGQRVKIYNALWTEDYSEPTGEFESAGETVIKSLEEDTGPWGGEFLIRLADREGYYVYVEADDGTPVLENHWDPDGYSGSSSMQKAAN